MRWARGAFYVLPLLVLGVTLVVNGAFGLVGADCHGDWLDGPWVCNELGEVQHDAGWLGLLLTVASVPVWALGMLLMGIHALLRRRRTLPS